ncbi:class I SAM-dependent methyltransferase [Syntrophobacter fumaroxidans]|uniref:Methyltransferase type 11 n=1 Tax=Syntrophobacter fumaroxidans (strain DSM 10017 / MPOB) TaxID=335543 RepID=A0LNM2_SYNFM|nr:class I SAM-dependent methyltransferase [Syntrophobacter fumaroxidans]ABK19024.1 Methyltransferase type 11 [Syntrophobacter fumaroxidans MPOB]
MKVHFSCPICGADRWEPLAKRRYKRSDAVGTNTPYLSTRLRILFELWLPGRCDVSLTVQGCRECGFVCYSPRPEVADTEAKYRFLSGIEKIGSGDIPADSTYELRRAGRLFRCVDRMYPITLGLKVLDYGGGDGRLLRYIADRGAQCFIVDYNDSPCPWVTRLGATVQDMSCNDARFDLVILSHVLEHVADPVSLLKSLGKMLAPEGMLYCEVPMELWRRLPQLDEPVTHLNFFTPGSLASTMRTAGYRVLKWSCQEYWATPPNHLGLALQCFCRSSETLPEGHPRSDLDEWLRPSICKRAAIRWMTSLNKIIRSLQDDLESTK